MTTTTALDTPARTHLELSRFLIGFAVAAIATILLAIVLVLAFAQASDGRVLPGVRAGNVDLGGRTPARAMAALESAYGNLSSGSVTVITPSGKASIGYDTVGRGPDAGAMTAAALAVGRQGGLVARAVDTVRTALGGADVPVLVSVDPGRLATRLHASAKGNDIPARDAAVVPSKAGFATTRSAPGRALDEQAVGASILAELSSPTAPAEITVQAADVTVGPRVTDADAERALAEARLMAVDVPLAAGTHTATIPAAVTRSAITFGTGTDGTYGPQVDASAIAAALASLTKSLNVPAVEPTVLMGKSGQPVGTAGGKNGSTVDVAATTENVVAYLTSLATGNAGATPAIVINATPPKLLQSDLIKALPNMKKLGSWTVEFFAGIANGNGANIRVPAAYVNGTVVAPGQQFSFLDAVGPITPERGFKPGGVIVNGKSNFTGAIGGGICSASTTLFNAALRAGLQIDERHNHAYYIDRYPVGLDATVFEDTGQVSDMKFTNDTANPILVRSSSTYSTVTFEIWGVPDGRTVKVSRGPETGVKQPGKTTTENVTTLPAGTTLWAEFPTPGFNVWAYRTVTAADGAVIHDDSWYSHYIVVNGVLQVGTGQ